MKKFFLLLLLAAGAHIGGHCQFHLPPIALSGVSGIHPIQLPRPAFTIVRLRQLPGARLTDGCTNTSCSVILPLTALLLQGHRLNNTQVALLWKTKNETLSRGFDIERSLGDVNHFGVAGTAASQTGNAVEKNYTQTDANGYAGISFYRIKQTDLDGKFTYSNTIEVSGFAGKEKAWLSPNPAMAQTTLNCFSLSEGRALVKLLNMHGQQLYAAPWNMYAGGNTLQLPVGKYASGMYLVQLCWPGGYCTSMKLEIR